jgi:hypothetical protein
VNNKNLTYFLISILLEWSVATSAQEKYHIYETQSTDTVVTIAKRFLYSHQREYGGHIEEYINDLKHWNPHITDWQIIPEATPVYVDFPYQTFPAPKLSIKNKTSVENELISSE